MLNFDLSKTLAGSQLKQISEENGKKIGKKEGEIETLTTLYHQKILTKKEYEKRVNPLKKQLKSYKLLWIVITTKHESLIVFFFDAGWSPKSLDLGVK